MRPPSIFSAGLAFLSLQAGLALTRQGSSDLDRREDPAVLAPAQETSQEDPSPGNVSLSASEPANPDGAAAAANASLHSSSPERCLQQPGFAAHKDHLLQWFNSKHANNVRVLGLPGDVTKSMGILSAKNVCRERHNLKARSLELKFLRCREGDSKLNVFAYGCLPGKKAHRCDWVFLGPLDKATSLEHMEQAHNFHHGSCHGEFGKERKHAKKRSASQAE